MQPVSPVMPGSQPIEVMYGKGQDEYVTLPGVYFDTEAAPVITRWRLDEDERKKVAEGGDIVMTLLRFRRKDGTPNLLTPSHLQVCLPDEMPLFVEEP